jgi:hypothetical protein
MPFEKGVNLGIAKQKTMKLPNESVKVSASIPFREYIEWKRIADSKRISVSRYMIERVRETHKKPPIQKEPWTEEEVQDIKTHLLVNGIGEHRRRVEAAAIRCKRAKRTAQNKDTDI